MMGKRSVLRAAHRYFDWDNFLEAIRVPLRGIGGRPADVNLGRFQVGRGIEVGREDRALIYEARLGAECPCVIAPVALFETAI